MAPVPALSAILFCAVLFIALFQYLFPRPARWLLVAAALVSGILCTLALGAILRRLVGTGLSSFEDLNTITAALRFAILRVGLPEEGAKSLAALIALAPFWRRATPAEAFQACLFVAVGFAIVENQGYATVFDEVAILMAFGRGMLATLTHTLLAMIFGLFLMRFAARGWRHWHLPVVGYFAAAGCHALYDAGMLPILSEFLKAMHGGKAVDPSTIDIMIIAAAVPFVIGGIALVLVAGLWSLHSAVRRAAADDPITAAPQHQVVVARWRLCGTGALIVGPIGLVAAIAWGIFAGSAEPEQPDMTGALAIVIGFAAGIFAIILGWVLRQKR